MDSEGKVSVRGSELKLFITIQMQVPRRGKDLGKQITRKVTCTTSFIWRMFVSKH